MKKQPATILPYIITSPRFNVIKIYILTCLYVKNHCIIIVSHILSLKYGFSVTGNSRLIFSLSLTLDYCANVKYWDLHRNIREASVTLVGFISQLVYKLFSVAFGFICFSSCGVSKFRSYLCATLVLAVSKPEGSAINILPLFSSNNGLIDLVQTV